jgi:hypothetical protein
MQHGARGRRVIMESTMKQSPRSVRPSRTLVALLATPVIGLAMTYAGEAAAAVRTVGNCNDSGSGSLRTVVAAAANGDTIDLRGLSCSRIILTSGQITIPQAALTLLGRSRYELTIDGNLNDRVFWHSGTGRLRIEDLSIANGNRDIGGEFDNGGCIRSEGSVELHRSRVHHCAVFTSGFLESSSAGGGVSAAGHVLLSFSAVFTNSATDHGFGGGVSAPSVTVYRSQVYNNFAHNGGGISAGTLLTQDAVNVTYSLIHGNRASNVAAGIYVGRGGFTLNKSTVSNNLTANTEGRSSIIGTGAIHGSGEGRRLIIDSTISGNHGHTSSAAFFDGEVSIYNSTIAFNVEDEFDEFATACTGDGALNAEVVHLESTIVARNTCLTGPGYDIGGSFSAFTIIGENNLIGRARIPVPPDTISADPRLAPLAESGGPTRTHLLLSDSPAINRGSNLLNRAYDQRGPGFPRVKGAFPDIGAIER